MPTDDLRATLRRTCGENADPEMLGRFESHLERCGGGAEEEHLYTRWLLFARRSRLCLCAPEPLRRRILGSLPHRQAAAARES